MGARLVADDLVVEEITSEDADKARRTVARHATDRDDLATLLAMLGLTSTQPEPPPPAPVGPPNPSTAPPPETDLRCVRCQRGLWHRSWPPEQRTGRVQLMARGLCNVCYKTDRNRRRNKRTRK